MQIRSTDPTRSRSIDDHDVSETPGRGDIAPAQPVPVWERLPTLESATAVSGGVGQAKAVKEKLEKLLSDVKDLQRTLAPFGKHFADGVHAAHEIEKGVELALESLHRPWLAQVGVPIAVATIARAIPEYLHAIDGLKKEAPEAARQAKPLLERVLRDVADLAATVNAKHATTAPPIERDAYVRG